MKKILLTLIMVASFAVAPQAKAWNFFNSYWFEPTLGCAAAGTAGYMVAGEDSNQFVNAAIWCAGGAAVGLLFNYYYDNKFGAKYQDEIADLKTEIRKMQLIQAMKASNGDTESAYSLKIQQIIPGQKLPNGAVTAPTVRESLVLPGEGIRVGE